MTYRVIILLSVLILAVVANAENSTDLTGPGFIDATDSDQAIREAQAILVVRSDNGSSVEGAPEAAITKDGFGFRRSFLPIIHKSNCENKVLNCYINVDCTVNIEKECDQHTEKHSVLIYYHTPDEYFCDYVKSDAACLSKMVTDPKRFEERADALCKVDQQNYNLKPDKTDCSTVAKSTESSATN